MLVLIIAATSTFRVSHLLVTCSDKKKAVPGEAVRRQTWWESRCPSQVGLGMILTQLLISYLLMSWL